MYGYIVVFVLGAIVGFFVALKLKPSGEGSVKNAIQVLKDEGYYVKIHIPNDRP